MVLSTTTTSATPSPCWRADPWAFSFINLSFRYFPFTPLWYCFILPCPPPSSLYFFFTVSTPYLLPITFMDILFSTWLSHSYIFTFFFWCLSSSSIASLMLHGFGLSWESMWVALFQFGSIELLPFHPPLKEILEIIWQICMCICGHVCAFCWGEDCGRPYGPSIPTLLTIPHALTSFVKEAKI